MPPERGFSPSIERIRALHDTLLRAYGPQGWWPGDTRLEIMTGAVLTQNTAWTNVERAIANLKAAGALDLQRLRRLPGDELAGLIRPAGYFNVKARRLRHLFDAVFEAGGVDAMAQKGTRQLRELLLRVHGIGPETADDILLYAFGRPVFVIDAYTRRLFRRLGWATGDETYDVLRDGVERAVRGDAAVLKELHALIVVHAKKACRAKPCCDGCVLARPLRCGGSDGSQSEK